MSDLETTLKIFGEDEIFSLLEVESASEIDLREDIPSEKLEDALRGLEKREPYDHILFENNSGQIVIQNRKVYSAIGFRKVGLSYYKRYGSDSCLVIRCPADSYSKLLEVYAANPSFWNNNLSKKRDPKKERENDLKIRFGFLHPVTLIVQAQTGVKIYSDSTPDENKWLYMLPTAVGYKLRK